MTGKAFWVAVDSLGGVARRRSVRVLIEDLAGLPAADIVGFADGLAWAVHALDTRRHAEHAAATASPGGASSTGMPSVDEFLLVRLAVVAAGEQVWRAVAADPARMSGIWATHEAAALLSAAAEAYERSTGARWDHQDPVGVATGSNRPAWDDAPAPGRDAWWNWLMVGGGWDIGVKDRPAFSLVRYELRRGLDQDPAWRAWWGYAPAPDLELFPFYSLKDPEPSKVRRGRKAVSVQADFDGEVVTRTPEAELAELVLQHLTVMLDLVREKLKLPAFPPFPEPLPDPMTPDEWRRQRREQAMAERAAAREQHDAPDPAASDPAPLSDADVPSDDRDGHTRYVAHFAHAIYWDDADDAAPFGSDEGADLWAAWQDRAEDLIPGGTVRTVLAGIDPLWRTGLVWWSGYVGGCPGGGGFVGGGADVAQGGVASAGVVPALDVVEDRRVDGGVGGPGPVLEELVLDGGEERFPDGVVPALAPTSVGEPDTEFGCGSGELG